MSERRREEGIDEMKGDRSEHRDFFLNSLVGALEERRSAKEFFLNILVGILLSLRSSPPPSRHSAPLSTSPLLDLSRTQRVPHSDERNVLNLLNLEGQVPKCQSGGNLEPEIISHAPLERWELLVWKCWGPL